MGTSTTTSAEINAAAFTRRYDLGVNVIRAAGDCLPPNVDVSTAKGHLMRVCLAEAQMKLGAGNPSPKRVRVFGISGYK